MIAQTRTKFEGIIITKTIFRERDLICHLLLRNGKQLPLLFYGGRGGGKKQKASFLELGYMVNVELQRPSSRSTAKDLFIAKEWKLGWHHTKLRENHKAFFLMCLFFELIAKVSVEDDSVLSSPNVADFEDDKGIFRVASNAVFHLEESLSQNDFSTNEQLVLFLIKLIYEMGINPELESCIYCGKSFSAKNITVSSLAAEMGGFSCSRCETLETRQALNDSNLSDDFDIDQAMLFKIFNEIRNLKYSMYAQMPQIRSSVAHALLSYFCLQFQLDLSSLKSTKLLGGY